MVERARVRDRAQTVPTGDGASEARPRAIVVVSNRLPVTLNRGPRGLERRRSAGGLVSALEPALRRSGGVWVGWPGTELDAGEVPSAGEDGYEMRGVALSEAEVRSYYHGFSNRTLWPLFHSLTGKAQFERREWLAYERVNRRFAETAAAECPAGGLTWVHDYQLILTPLFLRQTAPNVRIAFFLHIPFPPHDIFRLLPWDRELLGGLLACDVLGFHVEGYARNFLDCAERLLGARVDWRSLRVEHGDHTLQVGALPLGIDFDLYQAKALAAPPPAERRERVVLGVDRLDYTKGIPERILAFERLLELHPEHRKRVVLLQLAVPSRDQVTEYRQLKRQIDELVGRVNGRFATATWSPIRYLYRAISPEQLAGWYRDADVALVTPLRDGMNLVAKEFVSCQVAEPGVLVLSRLAGAAETMREALLVNPYNIDATAEALHRALTMDEAERRSRLVALRRRERRYNVHDWVERFLELAMSAQAGLRPPTSEDFEGWLGAFLGGYRLALFLDYEGTIAPIAEQPSAKARLSGPMRRAIEACAARDDTDVAIVSARALSEITKLVESPRLAYAGNDGLEIAGASVADFRHQDLTHYERRIPDLAAALADLAPGVWTEQRGPRLLVHFNHVEPAQHGKLMAGAGAIVAQAGFQPREVPGGIEARPPIGWDKGDAVLHVLRGRYGAAWSERVRVVYVGDDQTDEEAFRMLAGLAITFRVGRADSMTAAARRLPNVNAVLALVDWLGQRANPIAHGA